MKAKIQRDKPEDGGGQILDASSGSRVSRRAIAIRLDRLGLHDLSIFHLEALFRTCRRESEDDSNISNLVRQRYLELSDDEFSHLASSPAVAGMANAIAGESAESLKTPRLHDGRALSWTELPIRKARLAKYTDRPETRDIGDELELAHTQLAATRINIDLVGNSGKLFDLRRMGVLLERVQFACLHMQSADRRRSAYRYGSDDIAQISQSAMVLLYEFLLEYVTKVLALCTNILDLRSGVSRTPSVCAQPKLFDDAKVGDLCS